MLNLKDKIIEARLYSPHKCDELQPNPTGETKWLWGKKINNLNEE